MLPLTPHPDFPPLAIRLVEAEASRPAPGRLELRYVVTGAISKLLLPAPAAPSRTDDLWQHSCLEAFVRKPSSEAYHELNFSPSTQWAGYRLSGYRRGMTSPDMAPPRIHVSRTPDRFELRASLKLPGASTLGAWRLGLSAIIEEGGGRKSYWALAHPPGPPDFHHPHCFALELAAPNAP